MASKNSTMRRVSLRNLAAHKLRLALTVVAVVLGTAFISGAFMFTNMLSSAFDAAVSDQFDGVDVAVSGADNTPGVPVETYRAMQDDPELGPVNIAGDTGVVLGDSNSESIETSGRVAVSPWYDAADSVRHGDEITDGHAPSGPNELIINDSSAEEYGIGVGDELIVVDGQGRNNVTVVGTFSTENDLGNATSLRVDEQSYIDRYTDGAFLGQLMVSGTADEPSEDVLNHVQQAYPDVSSETGEKIAEEQSEMMRQGLSFIQYFLAAFGLVGLLVGTFLIANTFSMIVAQRTKEFALLRALGASRRQVTNSVVLEALLIGILGSLIGVVVGGGLVVLIRLVLGAQGMDLPAGGLGLSIPAVVVPLILGTLVTVISAWAPARRAGSIKPVEAMRSSESSSAQSLTVRTIVGSIIIALGVGAALIGALANFGTGARASLVGVGLVAVIIGFFLAGPAFSLPVVPTIGRVIGLPFGAIGKLAATNSRRNPRRTSTTAFALTLGIALVTSIGMLGATMKDSVSDLIDDNIVADFTLMGPTDASIPLPLETVERAENTDGVGEIYASYFGPMEAAGAPANPFGGGMTQVVDGNIGAVTTITPVETAPEQNGTLDLTDRPGAIVRDDIAEQMGWHIGDDVEFTSPMTGQTATAPLLGIYQDDTAASTGGQTFTPVVASFDTATQLVAPQQMQLFSVDVLGDGSVGHDQLRDNLNEALKDLIVVQVMDAEDIGGQAAGMIDIMLNILYGMLALAVVIAILGIVNTLTLNVIERRQEIGMLRAVGTHRGQIRIMITLEAVQIAVFGALSGIIIGLGLGWAFLTVLSDEGLDQISIPAAQLAWMMVGSVVVGLLAAIWPASRAAKTPALDAIAEE